MQRTRTSITRDFKEKHISKPKEAPEKAKAGGVKECEQIKFNNLKVKEFFNEVNVENNPPLQENTNIVPNMARYVLMAKNLKDIYLWMNAALILKDTLVNYVTENLKRKHIWYCIIYKNMLTVINVLKLSRMKVNYKSIEIYVIKKVKKI